MRDELSAPAGRPRGIRIRTLLIVAMFMFLAGGGAVVAISALVGPYALHGFKLVSRAGMMLPGGAPPALAAPDGGTVARVAALEARLDRIDLEANAEEANAARAEALLVAFATRRAIDRGAPLGYLEDQIRLRFGDALPNAVPAIIAAGKAPMTLDQLTAHLLAVAPQVTGTGGSPSTWNRLSGDIANLFVLRRDTTPGPTPTTRLDHALLCLHEGRVDDAIADVQLLPNPGPAQAWIAAARHYADIQRALDLLETTALLEPRQLHDGSGRPLSTMAPFAPVVQPTPAPVPSATPSAMPSAHL